MTCALSPTYSCTIRAGGRTCEADRNSWRWRLPVQEHSPSFQRSARALVAFQSHLLHVACALCHPLAPCVCVSCQCVGR